MTANTNPIYQAKPSTPGISITSSEGTALQTLFTATGDGALIDHISVTSTDTAIITLSLTLNDGTSDFVIGEVDIPVGAGTGTVPAKNLLDKTEMPFLQADGSLPMGASTILKIAADGTQTGTLDIVLFGGQYVTS